MDQTRNYKNLLLQSHSIAMHLSLQFVGHFKKSSWIKQGTTKTSSCKVILLPCICPYNLSDTLKRVHGSNKEIQKPPPAPLQSHSIALHLSFELPSLALAVVGAGHIETRKNDRWEAELTICRTHWTLHGSNFRNIGNLRKGVCFSVRTVFVRSRYLYWRCSMYANESLFQQQSNCEAFFTYCWSVWRKKRYSFFDAFLISQELMVDGGLQN